MEPNGRCVLELVFGYYKLVLLLVPTPLTEPLETASLRGHTCIIRSDSINRAPFRCHAIGCVLGTAGSGRRGLPGSHHLAVGSAARSLGGRWRRDPRGTGTHGDPLGVNRGGLGLGRMSVSPTGRRV